MILEDLHPCGLSIFGGYMLVWELLTNKEIAALAIYQWEHYRTKLDILIESEKSPITFEPNIKESEIEHEMRQRPHHPAQVV
jgi:hypothetical protein